MLQIVIPKDIDEYEPTLIGGLSTRKVICGGLGLLGVYVLWTVEKSLGLPPEYVPIWGIPAALAVIFGWIKPYGMKTEKFLQTAFVSNVLAPTNRIYCAELIDQIIKDEEYAGLTKAEIAQLKKDQEAIKKKNKRKRKIKAKNLKPEFIPYS